MPYPNFHAARVKNPDLFLRIRVLKTLDNGIMIYGGPLKSDPDGGTVTQAYRFPKDKFTVTQAKKWLKDNDIKYINFEEATEKNDFIDMSKLESKNFSISNLEVKEDDQGTVIEGYGAYFGNEDSYHDIIEKGAFAETIKGDNKDRIAFCYQHNMREPIGKIEKIKEDDQGLFVRVRISESEKGIAIKVREGILKEMSIGYVTEKYEWDENTNIRTLKQINLYEISLVTRAANPLALVTSIKADDFDLKRFETNELESLKLKIEAEIKARQPKTIFDYL